MTTHKQESKSPFIVLGALIFGALVCLGMATNKARAQTPLQIYGGVNASYGFANSDLSLSQGVNSASLNGLGSQGKGYGVHLGADVFLPNSPWFVGAFGDFTWQDVNFSAGTNTLGGLGLKAKLGDSWTIGSRIGLASGKTKYYGLLGYTQTDFSVSPTGFVIPANIKLPANFNGITYGVGVSHSLANNLAVGIEARMTNYKSAGIDVGVPGVNLAMQPDALTVMGRLSVQLGSVPNPVASAAPLK